MSLFPQRFDPLAPSPAPRRKRRWRRVAGILFLLTLLSLGWNPYSFVNMDRGYRQDLEDYLRVHPEDSEGWYALATCADRSCKNRGTIKVDLESLNRAIRLEARPLYLMTALGDRPDPELFRKLRASESQDAMVWMASSGYLVDRGEIDSALQDLRRALECPGFQDCGSEAIAIHRRFARTFYGEGYTADCVILRHELVSYLPIQVAYPSFFLATAEAGRRRLAGDLDGAWSIQECLYRIGDQLSHIFRFAAARELCELAVQKNSPQARHWKGVADSLYRRPVFQDG